MTYPATECFLIEQVGPKVWEAVVLCQQSHRCVVAGDSETELTWDTVDWPDACPECGSKADLHRSLTGYRRWRRSDDPDGEAQRDVRSFGPGAMWDASWMSRKGPDGRCLVVICPNGSEWMIDSRASNCGRPQDNEHRCWCRHGEPPNITVDKNCDTCTAGAGSIQAGDYHGFLQNGVLTAG